MENITSTEQWNSTVIRSQVPVFVDFWAEWCGPCRMIGPVLEDLAGDYGNSVKFVKVNVDQAAELASRYNVFSIPTLMLFNQGKLVDQKIGAADKESYRNMIENVIAA